MNKIFILFLGTLVFFACGKKNEKIDSLLESNQTTNIVGDPGSGPGAPPSTDPPAKPCVQVFYDDETPSSIDAKDFGKAYANMTRNLLGHFANWQIQVIPILSYKANDLEKCQASIYLGSDYYSYVPPDFIKDFKTTKKNVAWVGYSFWDLEQDLDNIFGVQFEEFTTLDNAHLVDQDRPSFFRDVKYKGEVFRKFNEWNKDHTSFLSAFEIAKLKILRSGQSEVLATIQHSGTQEEVPWALRSGNHFLITEIPLSYIHEGDRYLAFADLLFDILGEKPQRDEKLALLRLEDIHPFVEIADLNQAVQILRSEDIVPHISIIPIFHDPLGEFCVVPCPDEIPMTEVPNFMSNLRDIQNQGATFIWHGVTHQYKNVKNPFTGMSGDDFEFWDATRNAPIVEDSEEYIQSRLAKGRSVLQNAGITPDIWLTPHYQASALDNLIFGKTFCWNIGRMLYMDYNAQNPKEYYGNSVGQFFPYEIYGDMYGQNIIPENLGNVQPALNDQVVRTRSVDEILADAKRNLVLRDVWASVFYHPFLLEGQDPQKTDLQKLVRGMKSLGYRFVDLRKSNGSKF